ncbi:7207_t:CDS:2, partial [Racocetra persica]
RYEESFEKLKDIQKFDKGGFGEIYSAIWIDGKRKYTTENREIRLSREQNCKVALKSLNDSSNFLKEVKAYYECQIEVPDEASDEVPNNAPDEENCSKQGKKKYVPDKNKYVMVLEYADQGNLRTYLSKKENFTNLSWKQKIEILYSISNNLNHIHNISHLCHRDLHSGNILMTSAADLKGLKFNIFTVGSKIILVSRNNTGEKPRIEPKITGFGQSTDKISSTFKISKSNSTSLASSQKYQRIDTSIIA